MDYRRVVGEYSAAKLSGLIEGGNVEKERDSRHRLGELSDVLASLLSLLLRPSRFTSKPAFRH
jgi:hypothetical protein